MPLDMARLSPLLALLPPRALDRGRLLARRDRNLRKVVAHAAARVPYYRRLFDRCGLDPADVRTAADLRGVPFTTKQDLRREAPGDILAEGVDRDGLLANNTSGSTGVPFTVRRTTFEQRLTIPFWLRAFRSYGLRPGDVRATVSCPAPASASRGRKLKALAGAARLYTNIHLDCREQPDRLLDALCEIRPTVLTGYSGTLAAICDHARDRGVNDLRPRFVTCGAEVLTETMRGHISKTLRAPVYNRYGSLEMGVIAWQCRRTGLMHTCDDSLAVEVVVDGRPAEDGEEGELVATSLFSYAMPFVRYRMEDLVVRGPTPCPCGAPFGTLRRVHGRVCDRIVTPDGRLVNVYSITGETVETAPWIARCQVVQERPDRIVLRVVPSGSPVGDGVDRVCRQVRPQIGPGVEFEVVFVNDLEKLASGKYRLAMSLVEGATGAGGGK